MYFILLDICNSLVILFMVAFFFKLQFNSYHELLVFYLIYQFRYAN